MAVSFLVVLTDVYASNATLDGVTSGGEDLTGADGGGILLLPFQSSKIYGHAP